MKKTLSFLLALLMIFSFAACGKAEDVVTFATEESGGQTVTEEEKITDETVIRLMALQGPTGMGIASLLHNNTQNEGNRCRYEAELVSSAEISNIAAAIAKGECDIAAVPINLASTLYNKTNGNVRVLCANTLGVLYLLENGNEVNAVSDLQGKTLYATGKGSTPEFILRYVLTQSGIDPDKDVTINFVADHTELASMLTTDTASIGMLPEPNVSAVLATNPSFRVALDMTDQWKSVAPEGAELIQGVFIARKEFVDQHESLVKAFLKDYNDSQKLVNSDTDKGASLIVEAGILPKEAIAKKAIPGCNITYLTGEAMKQGVKTCLEVLFQAEPTSVGGVLPADDFYYLAS